MAIKASAQQTLIDLTDGYSVNLSNDNFTWQGDTSAVNGTQTTTCLIQALCGSTSVSSVVGTITCPTGLSIVSNGNTPNPTLTITATSALTEEGSVDIPITVDDTVVITKTFSWTIAYVGATGATGADGAGVTISSTSTTYATSSSGTTAPTTGWSTTFPTVSSGQYLWTRTTVTYTLTAANGTTSTKTTTTDSVSYIGVDGNNGTDGTSVSNVTSAITYQASSSGTTTPTGTWQDSVSAAGATQGQYLWTRVIVTYTLTAADGTTSTKTTTSYSVAYIATDGNDGADAITLTITSSAGTIFKNTSVATTLTAHVYQAGVELSSTEIAALGTIKWYKDGGTTAIATGTSLTISAGDVTNSASYIAQLED